ncbi:class I SAM-dependent methyltransferase [Planococcus sp. YIM B11945]|uniref:class I SAM-dependent methyltransferase n=1 Tax=Planococcus sp. YIM B11945 TaxID=3435410 RepID=UPI003D7D1153
MKLYKELAEWWPLMSPHTDYEEEATLYLALIKRYHPRVLRAIEFGSGGGSNAFYMKRHFSLVLSDLSEDMLAVSKNLNPDLRHIQGDMRTFDAGETFDLVFIHDAITYFTSEADLRLVMDNAKKHLNEGGVLLIMTDQFKETFEPVTSHGGIDKDGRGFRYVEWTYDLDSDDGVTETEYAYLMRDENGHVTSESDHSRSGLFAMADWERLLLESGFKANFERMEFTGEPGEYYAILAEQLPAE